LEEIADRFRYGGISSLKGGQFAYFINLQEIMGIPFGTPQPVQYYDRFYDADLSITARGRFSVRITDPILFFANVVPKNVHRFTFQDMREQFISEFMQCFGAAINQYAADGEDIRFLQSKANVLSKYMQEALDESWKQRCGIEIVKVGIEGMGYDEATKAFIQTRNEGAALKDANIREGYRQKSVADAFKAADKSEEKVILEGEECRISRRNMSDEWSHFEDVLSLRVFPCLSHLTLHKWYKNLYEYLEGYPFLRELELNNHGQKKLDFSKSYIDRLSVDMTGVEELVLNDGMEHLILFGEVSDNCKIRTEDNGSTLILYVDGKLPRLSGLDNLGSLHIRSIMELDIEEVLSRYPDLLELRLWGKPGNLINFDKLSGFSKLRFFSTMELFGFSEKDIPEPECFPNLCSLWMDSLPEDAAKMVKKLYKNRAKEGLHLWITKARKPEWLAQNLDNPFRSWDGREGITPSNAKKAADLYRKTRAQVVKLIEGPTSDFEQDIEALVRTYAEGFNKMDKRKYFITTIERDEVFDALSDILGLIPDELGLDKNRMIDIFDDVKEF